MRLTDMDSDLSRVFRVPAVSDLSGLLRRRCLIYPRFVGEGILLRNCVEGIGDLFQNGNSSCLSGILGFSRRIF